MARQTGAGPGAVAAASKGEGSRTPVADRIRKARARFHANDNIAAYIEAGELDQLRLEVAGKIDEVLRTLVIDTDSDHNTQDTARRVAKMYLFEVFAGRYVAQPPVTEFPNDARRGDRRAGVSSAAPRVSTAARTPPAVG